MGIFGGLSTKRCLAIGSVWGPKLHSELLMISETIASQINQLLYVVAQALAALTWFACWLHGQAYSTMYHEAGWVL